LGGAGDTVGDVCERGGWIGHGAVL
jgi:hypothetical protein